MLIIKKKYFQNIEIIKLNRSKYFVIKDEILEQAINQVNNEIEEIEEEEINETKRDELPSELQIDIYGQKGDEVTCDNNEITRYSCPKRINSDSLLLKILKLNNLQKKILLHIVHSFKVSKCQTTENFYKWISWCW